MKTKAIEKRLKQLTEQLADAWLGWRWKYVFLFPLVAIAVALSYTPVRDTMVSQQTWFVVNQSNVTLNFVLFFFFYGVLCDKLTKNMSRRRSWLIWAAGMVLLIVFFRFVGGYPTILG